MTKLIAPIDSAGIRGSRRQADRDCRWRASFLETIADRLDKHIEKLARQAKEYRDLAHQLKQEG